MTTKRKSPADQATDQRREEESESAKQADAERNNQPHEILNRSIMQRQGKKLHQQDGK
jgi:hypothetical protein